MFWCLLGQVVIDAENLFFTEKFPQHLIKFHGGFIIAAKGFSIRILVHPSPSLQAMVRPL
ncbi:MAG: hypothetical protein U0519_03720 [Candidatus Gracilibacteria bacterium]